MQTSVNASQKFYKDKTIKSLHKTKKIMNSCGRSRSSQIVSCTPTQQYTMLFTTLERIEFLTFANHSKLTSLFEFYKM